MGEVHRARAFGAAGVTKELCIKRIRRSRLSDPGALERFVDEARLWMHLSHGNIVPVFDFGRIENDYYLAMEWVDGCDLRRLLDDGRERGEPLEDDVVVFVTAAIARALSYLHDASAHEGRAVAHCDLKPSNVLVSRSGEVKLADFGVAVATQSARAGGTRGYIPPSESEGDRVDESADLYALGRVLSELLDRGSDPRPRSDERLAAEALARRLVASSDERAERLVASGDEPAELTAARVADELEALSAAARVRSGRSPRELLVARVARVPASIEPAETTDLRTDASFVTAGGDGRSFLSQMEARSERSTSSRKPPGARAEIGGRRRREWGAALAVAIVAVLAILWGRGTMPPGGGADTSGTASLGSAAVRPGAALGTTGSRATVPAVAVGAGRSTTPASGPLWDRLGTPAPAVGSDPSGDERRAAGRGAGAPGGRPPPSASGGEGEGGRASEASASGDERAGLAETPPGSADDGAETATRAHLRINARPWAEVTVDGVARGPTPITDLDVAPGRHEVRLVHPATGRESTTIVEVAPGEHRDVVVDLRL